ncbi:hypothetical protein [Oceanicaulis sp. HTCC2633]|uniref:CC0125/CC1285 family lipoprotein n=1 Tax=Oceanicaulis sp. HTCC2633 TaxID=314254 RepID=UPI0003262072|nr:hypothetical protein [Oceanicaulis sp. HTCC2633]
MRAHLLTGSMALTLLAGCGISTTTSFVSPPLSAYGPSSASMSGMGYDALQVGPQQWRVWYTGHAGASELLVEQYALRHAAEVAATAGYDWFRVTYDDNTRHANGYRPVSRTGEITPAYMEEVERTGPMGIVRNWVFREGPQGQITAILDIEAGRGSRPGGAYDPVAILSSYP